MHYSGVLVRTTPRRVDECARRLDSMPGVEVHYRYPESGRFVVVIESATLDSQKEALTEINSIPEVMAADLVYHYLDSEPVERHTPGSATGDDMGADR